MQRNTQDDFYLSMETDKAKYASGDDLSTERLTEIRRNTATAEWLGLNRERDLYFTDRLRAEYFLRKWKSTASIEDKLDVLMEAVCWNHSVGSSEAFFKNVVQEKTTC